jgi:G:T-mismatch repair DNA endonuclease (very short patch repair protein)
MMCECGCGREKYPDKRGRIRGRLIKGHYKATAEHRRKMSESMKRVWCECRDIMMAGSVRTAEKLRGRKTKLCSAFQKLRASEVHRGKIVSEDTRCRMRNSRLRFCQEHPEIEAIRGIKVGNALRGKKQRPEIVAQQCEQWRNPEYKAWRLQRMLKFSSPNRPECRIIELNKKYDLGFEYVGNGKLIIGGFNPDFVNQERRIVLEVYGDYWHNRPDWHKRDERRIAAFSDAGYSTIIIWEHEIVSRKGIPSSLTEEDIVNRILGVIQRIHSD